MTLAPFISHAYTLPEVALRQRMSDFPSPLKSPTPAMTQSAVAPPGEPVPLTDKPFRNQMDTDPELVLRHRMSDFPSPLKSPMPATTQSVVALPGDPCAMTVV